MKTLKKWARTLGWKKNQTKIAKRFEFFEKKNQINVWDNQINEWYFLIPFTEAAKYDLPTGEILVMTNQMPVIFTTQKDRVIVPSGAQYLPISEEFLNQGIVTYSIAAEKKVIVTYKGIATFEYMYNDAALPQIGKVEGLSLLEGFKIFDAGLYKVVLEISLDPQMIDLPGETIHIIRYIKDSDVYITKTHTGVCAMGKKNGKYVRITDPEVVDIIDIDWGSGIFVVQNAYKKQKLFVKSLGVPTNTAIPLSSQWETIVNYHKKSFTRVCTHGALLNCKISPEYVVTCEPEEGFHDQCELQNNCTECLCTNTKQ